MQNTNKLAILGGGNIGMSIAQGFIKTGVFNKKNITITRLASQPLGDITAKGIKATHNNISAITGADFIILAVQPRQALTLLKDIKGKLNKKQIIISVVTALLTEDIEEVLGKGYKIVRIMPNTAIAIGQSMTCLSSNNPSSGALETVCALFDKVGSTLVIDEKLMSSATVLSSCGTAFFLRFIRAASQGGIQVGFHAEEAQLIAAQVAKGAACLLLEAGNHPEQEIDKVTTPMGVTIKGLNEMEHHGLSSAVIKGIVHSYNETVNVK
jgi:pyrroline-5-carboxylate reductase